MQQKEQLLQHYKETESVGKKLESYKEKLRVDAQVLPFHLCFHCDVCFLRTLILCFFACVCACAGGEGC
jgi:hypothetical protein